MSVLIMDTTFRPAQEYRIFKMFDHDHFLMEMLQPIRIMYLPRLWYKQMCLKDVKFPLMLDVYELCTTELQEKMLPIRSKFKEVEDKKLEKQQQKVTALTETPAPFLSTKAVQPTFDDNDAENQKTCVILRDIVSAERHFIRNYPLSCAPQFPSPISNTRSP